MANAWVQNEWKDLCQRVHRSAEARLRRSAGAEDSIEQTAKKFCQQDSPSDYASLLERVRQAAQLTVSCQSQEASATAQPSPYDPAHGVVDAVDEAGMESFPASDPPAYSR